MKVQNPIIGRARGSAGGMTFSKNYDKNVARAKAFEVSDPKTQAQQTQRNFFKQLTALCADFSEDQLRTLFPSKPKTMSRRNAISKQIAEYNVVNGTTKSIDFVDIDTLGNAPVMNFGDIEVETTENTIIVTLANLNGYGADILTNYFIAILINSTKQSISMTTTCALVEDAEISFSYPANWETSDTIHAIPLITNSKESVADKGFGSFIIKTRPEKKNR